MPRQPLGRIRIVIIDSYYLLRSGLKLIIEQNPDMIVVGESGDLFEALELLAALKPDIIILSSLLLQTPCVDVIPKLLKAGCESQLIVLNSIEQPIDDLKAFQSGAFGIVMKTQSPEVLIKAIRKVYAGEVWIERSRIASLLTSISHNQYSDLSKLDTDRIKQLSRRERQVVGMISRMMKNQQIADQLGISEVTVRHHLTSIYSKLEVTGRLELLVFSQRHGLSEFDLTLEA